MKLAKSKLQKIIKEEANKLLKEQRRLTPPLSRHNQIGLELARKSGLLDEPPLSDKQVATILKWIKALSPQPDTPLDTPPGPLHTDPIGVRSGQEDLFKDWLPHISWRPGPEDLRDLRDP